MQQISNIKVAMEELGTIETIMLDREDSLLFSLIFADRTLNIANNEIVYKSVEKIKERFNIKNFYAGTAVMGLVEKRVG